MPSNCLVGIPAHGPGTHPDGGHLALDGRFRSQLASQDLVDGPEHTGSLFWLVHRSTDESKANMVIEPVTWEHRVTLTMPFKKQKRSVDWDSKDLLTVPGLLNRKAIHAHERLVVHYEAPTSPNARWAREEKKES